MHTTTRSGTVQRNNAGTHKTWSEPIPSGQSLGRKPCDTAEVGAGQAQPARACAKNATSNPQRGDGGQLDGPHAAGYQPEAESPPQQVAEPISPINGLLTAIGDLSEQSNDPQGTPPFVPHETIEYAGERIPVRVVAEINVARGEGMEYLLVDQAHRYFFRREVHDVPIGFAPTRRELPGYRCLIHRISLSAAILCQVTFGADPILRKDAADLLGSLHGRDHQPSGDCVTVTLDEHASELARRCLRYNEHAPVHHLGDLINAAVAFFEDDTDQGVSTLDQVEQARARRLARGGSRETGGTTAVTLHLSAAQLRMFQQIADYQPHERLANVVTRELGQHVALHLECYYGHSLDTAKQGWEREGKEVVA